MLAAIIQWRGRGNVYTIQAKVLASGADARAAGDGGSRELGDRGGAALSAVPSGSADGGVERRRRMTPSCARPISAT